jgi:hypothetical protein
MAATTPSIVSGTAAPTLRLPATDGRTYTFDDIAGRKGTVIVFICNHCPYVKAVIDRLVSDAKVLMAEGISFAAICSNDAKAYPEDSFDSRWREPTVRSARRTSSDMTMSASSDIAAASTRVARPRSHRARATISWRLCARSRWARRRRSSFRRSGCSIKWKAA